MQIKFIASQQNGVPDFYSFDGDIVTAYFKGQKESFDLSDLQHGDVWQNPDPENDVVIQPEVLPISGSLIIRHAERDAQGGLHVTLAQRCPMNGHWREGGWLDSNDYAPGNVYVEFRQTDGSWREFDPQYTINAEGDVIPLEDINE